MLVVVSFGCCACLLCVLVCWIACLLFVGIVLFRFACLVIYGSLCLFSSLVCFASSVCFALVGCLCWFVLVTGCFVLGCALIWFEFGVYAIAWQFAAGGLLFWFASFVLLQFPLLGFLLLWVFVVVAFSVGFPQCGDCVLCGCVCYFCLI